MKNPLRGLTNAGTHEQQSREKTDYSGWEHGPVTVGAESGEATAVTASGLTVTLEGVGALDDPDRLIAKASGQGIRFTVDGRGAGQLVSRDRGLQAKDRVLWVALDADLEPELRSRLEAADGAYFRSRGYSGGARLEDEDGVVVQRSWRKPKTRSGVGPEIVLVHRLVDYALLAVIR